MSLLNHTIHFQFFKNKEFNNFYLAIFIMTFGESLINIFVPIYLYTLGFKIYEILFFYFMFSLFFVIFAYFGAKVTAKVGEKHSMIISVPFLLLYYVGLIFVGEYKILIFLLPLILSIRGMLFYYGYHLNFVNHTERGKRGQQIASVASVALLATVIAPYLGGLLANINFTLLFAVSSSLIILGTLPLFFSKDKSEKIDFTFKSLFSKIKSNETKGNIASFSGYAIESNIGRTVWPIFLIIVIGTIEKTGLIISISMLLSLLAFHTIGKMTDKVNKIKLLKWGTVFYFFAWVGRIFADTVYKVVFIDSYKNISEKIVNIPWNAHIYDLAQRKNHFEFVVSREIIYNSIRVIVFPILILLFYINFYPFVISFVIASLFTLLYIFIEK